MQYWGKWRPDVSGPNTPFANIADGVIPRQVGLGNYGAPIVGYGPFQSLAVPITATALAGGAPRGSISLVLQGGAFEVFYATATTIEQLQANYTFNTIESGRTVTSGDDVSFLHFGAYLLNTDTLDGFKAYNVEAPAGNNVVAGAPTARYIFSCNNVVFALDCNGNNLAWKSSATGDHTNWTSGGANGGTFQDGQQLICGVDMKNGNALIFQKAAMRLVQFGNAATPALFSIVKAADGRGSVGARSVVSFDGMAFFLDTTGFYKFDLSNGNTPIGAEKFNEWFFSQISTSNLAGVQGAVDPERKIVCWAFSSLTNVTANTFDRIIGYDWVLDEGFTATLTISSLQRLATPGYVLDAMDGFGPLDSITTPLDDRFWQGGAPVLAGTDASFKVGTFTGANLAATLQTSQAAGQKNMMMTEITPISDNPSSTIQVGVQYKLSDMVIWKAPVGRNRAGRVPIRASGLNLTFQENHAAGDTWTYSQGVDYPVGSQGGPV